MVTLGASCAINIELEWSMNTLKRQPEKTRRSIDLRFITGCLLLVYFEKIHPPLNNCEHSLIRINDKLLRYHLNGSQDMILHNFI